MLLLPATRVRASLLEHQRRIFAGLAIELEFGFHRVRTVSAGP